MPPAIDAGHRVQATRQLPTVLSESNATERDSPPVPAFRRPLLWHKQYGPVMFIEIVGDSALLDQLGLDRDDVEEAILTQAAYAPASSGKTRKMRGSPHDPGAAAS